MMENLPIACDMTALTDEQHARREMLFHQLAQRVERVEEIEHGYAFYLNSGDSAWITAAEFVDYERRCCPFFTFALQLSPTANSVQLCLTGSEGTKEFVASQFIDELAEI